MVTKIINVYQGQQGLFMVNKGLLRSVLMVTRVKKAY